MTDRQPEPPRRDRPAPLIPPDRRRDAPLFFVVAILVFLACLAGLASRGAIRAASEWTSALDASATVQILAEDAAEADADAARAAEILGALPGVVEARPVPQAEADALLAPWFGTELPEELPAPRLVALTLDAQAPPDMDALRAALQDAELEAELDDHARWQDDIMRATRAAQVLSLAVVSLLVAAAAAVTVFAAQAGLAAKRDVIEALRVAGAADGMIAFLFLRRFFLMGLGAGAGGPALAGIAMAALYIVLTRQGGLIVLPEPGAGEALVLLAAPAAAAVIGAATAWITVLVELGRNA